MLCKLLIDEWLHSIIVYCSIIIILECSFKKKKTTNRGSTLWRPYTTAEHVEGHTVQVEPGQEYEEHDVATTGKKTPL